MPKLLKWIESRPTSVMAFGGIAALLATVLALIAVMALPVSTITTKKAGESTFSVAGLPAVAGGTAEFVDRSGEVRLSVPLRELATPREPSGSSQQIAAFVERRDRIAAMLREPGMELRLPDGRTIPAAAETRSWRDLGFETWLVLSSGLIAALAGLWVFVLRPREEGARAFAISGIAYQVITFTMFWYHADNPAMSGGQFMAYQAVNVLFCSITAIELIWLFARYPIKLVPRRWLAIAYAVVIPAQVWAFVQPWPDLFRAFTVFILSTCPLIVGFLLTQAWLTRRDPAMRVAFLWIGSTLLLAISLEAWTGMIPSLFGPRMPITGATSNAVFTLFFIALGVGVARFRLFDLGQWTVGILRTVVILLLILIVDIFLALIFGQGWVLSLGLVAAALVWLPLRSWVVRKTERRKALSNIELVKSANRVAFAGDIVHCQANWRKMLVGQFDPLECRAVEGRAFAIANDGRDMIVPSPLDGGALNLSFAAQGGRLFGSEDLALARAMSDLVLEISEARRAFERGAEAERMRIARDLHDDVGARLMTSLHRDDIPAVRADVREALADMRLLIDGLSGQSRYLADTIADLRHETVNRLKLAGIAVHWPVSENIGESVEIPQSVGRIIYSVTRELVTNVIRHSGASQVTVEVGQVGEALKLSLQDDGRGFAPACSASVGNGLNNARKRMLEIGGTLDVHSPAAGSRVEVRIPLASPEQGICSERAVV